MEVKQIIKEFREALKNIYKENLVKIILYGSYARGDFNSDSDIDLLIVLEKLESPGKEIDRMIEVISEINLKYNVLISVFPVSIFEYNSLKSPLLLNVRREGIEA
ncbi:MAG: nucleotidyltransferase domain-containing protein [Bacteroidetes bacterium]|nr:nucleotidyltransferase domain-containing protein [Bacteroidota bacterium]